MIFFHSHSHVTAKTIMKEKHSVLYLSTSVPNINRLVELLCKSEKVNIN